jgi:hypothetical protein
MHSSRLLQPLFLAFVLLFAQQAGAAHALSHAVEDISQHQDKHLPDSPACEKCANYAQLGSALSTGIFDFVPPQVSNEVIGHSASSFQSIHTLAAVARGPPSALQKIV